MERTERTPDDARYWLVEAEMRLEQRAGIRPGGNARIFTEQAHYAAEFFLKAVIVSRGGTFATTHNSSGAARHDSTFGRDNSGCSRPCEGVDCVRGSATLRLRPSPCGGSRFRR